MAEAKSKLAVGCLGLVVGGLLGAALGGFSAYAIAERWTGSRESQAYLTLLIVPAIGFIGALTALAALRWRATRRVHTLALAVLGGVLLTGAFGLGASWRFGGRDARMRVQNATTVPFEGVFLGGDFRRSVRVGDVAAGATSAPVTVDLSRRGTFDAIEGRAGDSYVRHRLPDERVSSLPDGDYVWVVGGAPGAFTYELVPATSGR